jgi:hypothetical protein
MNLASLDQSKLSWDLLHLTERILVLYKYSPHRELILSKLRIPLGVNFYSTARVFYDHSLQMFETIGLRSLKDKGISNDAELSAFYGTCGVLCNSKQGLDVVKGQVTLS